MVEMALGLDWDFATWRGVFMEGGGWYSMWSNVGVGGSRALRRVRSMNGGIAMERPRAISDHVLMKWREETPSDSVWCTPHPRETPPHLKRVTCLFTKQMKQEQLVRN